MRRVVCRGHHFLEFQRVGGLFFFKKFQKVAIKMSKNVCDFHISGTRYPELGDV